MPKKDNGSQYPLRYAERNLDFEGDDFTELMEFRLVYEGALKGSGNSNTRVPEKHAIRKQIHKQLAELWKVHPNLSLMNSYVRPLKGTAPSPTEFNTFVSRGGTGDYGLTYVETMARDFDRCGFRFVPLVSKRLNFVCSLNVLFLRRENPGELITQSGDIDNRMKTLFDALKMPQDCGELPKNAKPEPDENPFFCLLQNDSLVTELNVTTDRLLRPPRPDEHPKEVVLIIQVKIKAVQVTGDNLAFL